MAKNNNEIKRKTPWIIWRGYLITIGIILIIALFIWYKYSIQQENELELQKEKIETLKEELLETKSRLLDIQAKMREGLYTGELTSEDIDRMLGELDEDFDKLRKIAKSESTEDMDEIVEEIETKRKERDDKISGKDDKDEDKDDKDEDKDDKDEDKDDKDEDKDGKDGGEYSSAYTELYNDFMGLIGANTQLEEEKRQLEEEKRQLEEQKKQLEEKILLQEQKNSVTQDSLENYKDKVEDLEARIVKLEEELANIRIGNFKGNIQCTYTSSEGHGTILRGIHEMGKWRQIRVDYHIPVSDFTNNNRLYITLNGKLFKNLPIRYAKSAIYFEIEKKNIGEYQVKIIRDIDSKEVINNLQYEFTLK